MHILYKTKDCVRCPLAARSMRNAGVEFEEVFLDNPENSVKRDWLVEDMKVQSVPVVETPDGRLLTNMATISEEFRGMSQ